MSGATVQLLGADQKPVTTIRPDQSIEIRVTLPEGTPSPPSTVTVTVTSDKGTTTIDVPKQTGAGDANPTYSTGSIQLGHGVAEGYGIGKGATARLDIGNGATVHVSSDQGGGAQVRWYPDDLQEAIGEHELVMRAFEAYLRQVQIGLHGAASTPEVAHARRIIEEKLKLIEEAKRLLANAEIWPRSKLYLLQRVLGYLRQPGVIDLREAHRDINNAIEQGKQEGRAIVLSGFADLTMVFYEQFTSATGAAAMWTVVFGQDIYGKDVTGKDRLLAAAELGLTAVMTVLPILHMREMTVGRTPTRIPRGRPEIPRPIGGVSPKGAPAGVRATAEEFGMLPEAAAHVNTVASRNGAIIQVRPTNQSAMRWREAGHPGKPMDIKAKTINELDVHLGARQEDIGLVGYFEPKVPTRRAGMSDREWAEVQTRYADRAQEFRDNATKMDHLRHDGKIAVDQHGVVIDTGICGGTGKGITGDYDLWRITKPDGTSFSAIDEEMIVNQLRFGAYGAQHGAHTSWKIDPKAPMYVADPDLLKGHLKVDADIRAKHQLGADRAEAVIEFGGTNRPPVTAYEGGAAPGSVTAPGPAAAPPIPGARRITGRTRIAAGAAVLVMVVGVGWVTLRSDGEVEVDPSAVAAGATTSSTAASVNGEPPAAAAPNRPPGIGRMTVTFDQASYTTTYTVAEVTDADGDDLTVRWHHDPQEDCGVFQEQGLTATWTHPHESQRNDPRLAGFPSDRFCKDPTQGQSGHPGRVGLTADDGTNECLLAYAGGSNPGEASEVTCG